MAPVKERARAAQIDIADDALPDSTEEDSPKAVAKSPKTAKSPVANGSDNKAPARGRGRPPKKGGPKPKWVPTGGSRGRPPMEEGEKKNQGQYHQVLVVDVHQWRMANKSQGSL